MSKVRQWCSDNRNAFRAIALGSIPRWHSPLICFSGSMAEHLSSEQKVVGSSPIWSNIRKAADVISFMLHLSLVCLDGVGDVYFSPRQGMLRAEAHAFLNRMWWWGCADVGRYIARILCVADPPLGGLPWSAQM